MKTKLTKKTKTKTASLSKTAGSRTLLTTMTGEMFQPTRLYYSIVSKPAVIGSLTALRCVRAPAESNNSATSIWHYDEEAERLEFARPRHEVPDEVHPIILGQFRFASKEEENNDNDDDPLLVLELRSGERAIEAAKFFGPKFGSSAVLRRVRIINRLFEASEISLGLERLDKLLDANVVRIDPAATEAAMEAVIAKGRTPNEKQRLYLAYCEERRKKDIPLVEDLPLAPEEETSDFQHLAMTLRLRTLRAYEHWKGNTHLTLSDIIHCIVENGGRGLSVQVPSSSSSFALRVGG